MATVDEIVQLAADIAANRTRLVTSGGGRAGQ
jgi:hypothetical protein